jgi:Leucine-rich repeat (LRR) protein
MFEEMGWIDVNDKEQKNSGISAKTKFFVHCSNLQAWVENKYNSNMLHSNISFPLLRELYKNGDPLVKKIFKEEIAKRFTQGNQTVRKFLEKENYLTYLTPEEILTMFQEIKPESLSEEMFFILIKKYPCFEKNNLEVKKYLQEEYCHGKHVVLNGLKHFVSYGKLSLRLFKIKSILEIKGLNKLINLRELDLYKNEIPEITGLDALINLRKLFLQENKIKHIFGLDKLTNLTTLCIEWNQVEEISGLDTLINLKNLDLRGNCIGEIKGSENLGRLERLCLNDNKITQICGLENLFNLRSLDLGNNRVKEIGGLNSLGKLFYLNLSRNRIRNVKGLGSLERLTLLDIGKNEIPKGLLKQLGGIKQLGLGRVENVRNWVNYCKETFQ